MKRRHRIFVALGSLLLLAVGCTQEKSGTAIPDGDDVAEYVSEKFEATLDRLTEDITGNEPRKSVHTSFTRINDKKSNYTITALQVGNPPSRFYKNHSNRDPDDQRDFFIPAESDVEYLRLGPTYADLAPTRWVSLPHTADKLNNCYWGGYASVCRMLETVNRSMQQGNATKQAKSLPDGSVELTAKTTLREFLNQRVVVMPDWILEQISETMKDERLDVRILLTPDDKLQEIEMTGLISVDGDEVEVKEHFRVQDPPTEDDLPVLPESDQVTELTEEQTDELYDGMGEITSSQE